jgi:hypothetical protein
VAISTPVGSAHRERGMRIENFELENCLKNIPDLMKSKKIWRKDPVLFR